MSCNGPETQKVQKVPTGVPLWPIAPLVCYYQSMQPDQSSQIIEPEATVAEQQELATKPVDNPAPTLPIDLPAKSVLPNGIATNFFGKGAVLDVHISYDGNRINCGGFAVYGSHISAKGTRLVRVAPDYSTMWFKSALASVIVELDPNSGLILYNALLSGPFGPKLKIDSTVKHSGITGKGVLKITLTLGLLMLIAFIVLVIVTPA